MQKVKAEIVKPETYSFGTRVETGVVEFEYPTNEDGDQTDWPGVFIRGDDALLGYAPALEYLIENIEAIDSDIMDVIALNSCKGLLDLLQKCRVQ